ncbi:MAG: hypothetical protein K0U54_12430 [Bacteroidetes bacterium]|nr:hypothetical protein [Bacteroidota bacterium]
MEYFGFLIVARNAAIGFLTITGLKWLFKPKTVPQDHTINFLKSIFKENLKNALKVKELEMQAVHDEEKAFLLAEITKLNNRIADFEEMTARTIATLETTLASKDNGIGAEKLEDTKTAIEKENQNE